MSKIFFVGDIPSEGHQIEINDPNEVRHILKALRLKPGDEIRLSNGKGKSAVAEIIATDRKKVISRIVSTKEEAPHSGPTIYLWQGCLKGTRMDWLVEKITELGVDRLCPVICEFSVSSKDKKERWERIAKAALKQSNTKSLLEIENPISFSELPQFNSGQDLLFVLSLEEDTHLGLAQAIQNNSPIASNHIHLFVGPEGGFSPNELSELKKIGAISCTLGSSILRGETAGLLAAGIARHSIDFLPTKKI